VKDEGKFWRRRLGNPQDVADGHDAIDNRPCRDETDHGENAKLGHIIAAQLRADVAAEFVERREVPASRWLVGSS